MGRATQRETTEHLRGTVVVMRWLTDAFAIAAGAAIGANLRYWIGFWFIGKSHPAFPWHTLIINVTGSLALGAIVALAMTKGWDHGWRLFASVGLCGGYTTFSTYSAETIALFEEKQIGLAVLYIVGSNALAILACLLGAHLARIAWPPAHP